MPKNQPIFKGVATALITPFEDGKIDYASLAGIIEYQIEQGVDALVVCGTTGESATLTIEERATLVRFCVERSAGRVPVIAGTGSNSTHRSVSLSIDAARAGADALLVVTPYYNKASKQGIIEHYNEIASHAELPVIVYNVPSRTGMSITPEIYARLMENRYIVGIKEASGNIASCIKTLALSPDAQLYSGNDCDTLPILSIGGMGVISVVSNILPRLVHDMCYSFMNGETQKSASLQKSLHRLNDCLFAEVNPIPIKYAMSLLGMCKNQLRLPLTPLTEPNMKELAESMEDFFPSSSLGVKSFA